MAYNKIVLADGTILIDLTQDTVTSAADIVAGKVGHLADGSIVTGTGSGGGVDGDDLAYGATGGAVVGSAIVGIAVVGGDGGALVGSAAVGIALAG